MPYSYDKGGGDTDPDSFRKGSKLILGGRKNFDSVGFQFIGPVPFSLYPRG